MHETSSTDSNGMLSRPRYGLALIRIIGLLTLIGIVLWTAGDAAAQKIKVLESDTLRTSERRERGLRVTIDTEDDSTSASVRIGSSRWRRGGHESSSLVRFGEDIIIEAEDVVDGSAVAFGGDVIVRGRVLEDVVCFGGEIRIEDGGVVEGDAAAFGGEIDRAPNSDLFGEEVDIAFIPTVFGGTLSGPGGGRFFWFTFSLSVFLFLGIAGLVTEWILPLRVRRIAEHVRASLWPSFFVGLAVQVLFGPTLVLLCVTVIGIPVALLLPLVLLVAQVIGFLVVAAVIGAKFSDGLLESRPAWVRSVLAGVAFLTVGTLVAVLVAGLDGVVGNLGRLLLLSTLAVHWTVSTIGMGSVILSRFGGRGPSSVVGGPDDSVPEFNTGTPRTI